MFLIHGIKVKKSRFVLIARQDNLYYLFVSGFCLFIKTKKTKATNAPVPFANTSNICVSCLCIYFLQNLNQYSVAK